ncbi:MAG: hypothetical protein D6820_04855 [Lentisphaerae bacterium]|nr:MAG: hypothetical protein D6820_04855 [Lentisphaerota bacterium]
MIENKIKKGEPMMTQQCRKQTIVWRWLLSILGAFLLLNQSWGQTAFQDVSKEAGLAYQGESFGVCWGDFDGDGDPDLYVNKHLTWNNPPSLWRNNGDGTFTDVFAKVVVDTPENVAWGGGDCHSAVWVDIDNDGDQDLLQVNGGGGDRFEEPVPDMNNRLYINENGKLVDKAPTLGMTYGGARSQLITLLDYNNDGLLDFIDSAYAKTKTAPGTWPSTIFRQLKDHTFRNTGPVWNRYGTSERHPESGDGSANFSLFIGDGVQQNNLWTAVLFRPETEGPSSLVCGGFRRVYDLSQTPFTTLNIDAPSFSVWDVQVADFDGDGRLDVLMTTKFGSGSNQLRLLRNTPQGMVDITSQAGIGGDRWGRVWSIVAADFDNDMDVDIFVTTGTGSGNTPDVYLDNDGHGVFTAVANAGGAAGPTGTNVVDTVTTVDYNDDGFLDLYVTNGYAPVYVNGKAVYNGPSQLFRNKTNSNHWLKIDLEGKQSNRDGIGAMVFLRAGGVEQVRLQNGGCHTRAQSYKRLHFGLGQNRSVEELRVLWPSGIVTVVRNIAADQTILVREDNSQPPAGADNQPPPVPDWRQRPVATGSDRIAMSCIPVDDPSTPVEYQFQCISGGGHNSAWLRSTSYEDTGLLPGNTYTYRVRARDGAGNVSAFSIAATAETASETPGGHGDYVYLKNLLSGTYLRVSDDLRVKTSTVQDDHAQWKFRTVGEYVILENRCFPGKFLTAREVWDIRLSADQTAPESQWSYQSKVLTSVKFTGYNLTRNNAGGTQLGHNTTERGQWELIVIE